MVSMPGMHTVSTSTAGPPFRRGIKRCILSSGNKSRVGARKRIPRGMADDHPAVAAADEATEIVGKELPPGASAGVCQSRFAGGGISAEQHAAAMAAEASGVERSEKRRHQQQVCAGFNDVTADVGALSSDHCLGDEAVCEATAHIADHKVFRVGDDRHQVLLRAINRSRQGFRGTARDHADPHPYRRIREHFFERPPTFARRVENRGRVGGDLTDKPMGWKVALNGKSKSARTESIFGASSRMDIFPPESFDGIETNSSAGSARLSQIRIYISGRTARFLDSPPSKRSPQMRAPRCGRCPGLQTSGCWSG
jgi:hypothetical protein